MATIRERLTAVEQEQAELKHDNSELKQKVELQTMAISGLVNKTMLERITEKNDKIFQALIAHDKFTNRQLSEFRERVEVQVEGKIAGMQTEMRQGFKDAQNQIVELDGKIVGMQTEMRQRFEHTDARFEQMDTHFEQIDAHLGQQDARFERIDARFEQMDTRFERIDARFEQIDARFEQIVHMLTALSPKPDEEE